MASYGELDNFEKLGSHFPLMSIFGVQIPLDWALRLLYDLAYVSNFLPLCESALSNSQVLDILAI